MVHSASIRATNRRRHSSHRNWSTSSMCTAGRSRACTASAASWMRFFAELRCPIRSRNERMKILWTIIKRELVAYFTSPVAYVFLVIFLLLTGFFPFTAGSFFERGEASLASFFGWHPWLYLVLVPAVGMRVWAEERRSGTMELLLTLPVATWQAIVAKFLASWLFLAVALVLTFPAVITVNILGEPDNGVIFGGYLGSFFLAGAYLAITCMTS